MQILPQQAMGYDRTITVWSPDGRLLQVEYAKKTVGLGALTIGIVYKDGVLLVADRRIIEKLMVAESVHKISIIDEKIATTFSGYTSDARVLIKKARLFAQQYKLTYGESPDTEEVVKYISDIEQSFTQYGGIRPFGIAFLFGGFDKNGPVLFETDPSGIYTQYLARAIGSNSTEANKLLEKKYKDNLKLEDVKKIAIDIFKEILDKEFNLERLEGSIITSSGVKEISFKE
ncbi:MAG: archaeal proteasome endopeptidase complex subunit alpha [Candidatus Nanoarchaeia archaeon]